MRLIKIDEYDYNKMILAKPIYDSKKRILIASGKSINPRLLDRLKSMGIVFLFVEDEISKGISIDDMLDMPTWTDCIQSVKLFFEQVKDDKSPDIRGIQQVGKKLIDEVKVRPFLVLIPSGAIAKELQPYAHAVNVTILSLLTAKKVGYNGMKLQELAMGSLIHDLGKVQEKDYSEHPEEGFNIIRNVREMSLISAHIAYQHHETIDGEGFPRGIGGKEILEVAQICGLANTYENLISKEQRMPHDAMEAIMSMSDRKFNFNLVEAFTKAIPTYPPGTKILIADKEKGIVTRINQHLQRPVVKVISKGKELDLADYPTLMIKPG